MLGLAGKAGVKSERVGTRSEGVGTGSKGLFLFQVFDGSDHLAQVICDFRVGSDGTAMVCFFDKAFEFEHEAFHQRDFLDRVRGVGLAQKAAR